VAIVLAAPGELPVTGFQVLGHRLFEHLLQYDLHTLPDASLHVPFHDLLEFLLRGQVCLLTQPTTYQTLSTYQLQTVISNVDKRVDTVRWDYGSTASFLSKHHHLALPIAGARRMCWATVK
jgi:hypothetical protein